MVQEYMFESFDGTELYGKTDSVADPRGVVVIVHGLCEHQGRYDYLTMRLNARGYSVYRFDHRGHGRSKKAPRSFIPPSMKSRKISTSWSTARLPKIPSLRCSSWAIPWAATARRCMGTCIQARSTATCSRAHGPATIRAWAQARLRPTLPIRPTLPNELGDGVCSDPSVGEAYMADPYVIKEMSFGLFRALHKGHAWMRENASRFVDPVLILHGGDDGLSGP